ncbi:MAG: protein translocase subunit SecF, partial [Bdellovibrionales bacterium]
MKGIKFIPDDTALDFIGKRFLAFAVSAVLVLGSVFLTVQNGLNFGIDFTGGSVIEVKTPEAPDLAVLRDRLNGLGLGAISIQEFGAADDLLIRLPQQQAVEDDGTAQKAAIEALRGALDESFD